MVNLLVNKIFLHDKVVILESSAYRKCVTVIVPRVHLVIYRLVFDAYLIVEDD